MRLFASLHSYRRPWLRGDLIAGLTLWAILVPQALAYASIANVSPVVGLYAAPGALAAVRSPWQLAGARHGSHGGRRGPVGGHGR
jgi:MFS superfamily sulfate permease-like transporter